MDILSESIEADVLEHVESELVSEPPKKGRPFGAKSKQTARWNKKEAEILQLSALGKSPYEISKIVGCSPVVASKKIKDFAPVFKELANISSYRDLKTDLLSATELATLKNAVSPAKLKKASMLDSIKAFDIVNKANRLHNGLSTSNEAHKLFGKVSIVSSPTTKKDPE